jgi:hypothetical protein
MLKTNVLKICAMALAASVLGMSSCKEDESSRLSIQDTADLTEEALTDAYFQDTDDIAGVAIDAPDRR